METPRISACVICGAQFRKKYSHHITCSSACADERGRLRARARGRRVRQPVVIMRHPWGLQADPYDDPTFMGVCFDGRRLRPASHAIMCPVV